MAIQAPSKNTVFIQMMKSPDGKNDGIQASFTPVTGPNKAVQKKYADMNQEQKLVFDTFVTMITNLS